jgi:phenylacetate-coenzyme A ligase PaaK-like adenylate-forming protein
MDKINRRVFQISNDEEFSQLALEIFRFQSKNNPVYREFVQRLNHPTPTKIQEIPFLPISFFKSHQVRCYTNQAPIIFKSSGTVGIRSTHFVEEPKLYESSFEKTYREQIGAPEDQLILALLPNYIEQGESSLVYMVEALIRQTNNSLSGFYLNDPVKIIEIYNQAKSTRKKIILFGVSYALLDLAEHQPDLSEALIIETGGMKGRRKELTKEELHKILKSKFNVVYISSEYGMTELLSQAYSDSEGLFTPPKWMKVLIRETNDPFAYASEGKTGGINIIDLANLNSCSFIATQDLGKIIDSQFQLMGRFDNSDIRGCNLLVE